MKKTALSLALLVTLFAGAYASDPIKKDPAKEKALKSFAQQFSHATDATVYDHADGFIVKSHSSGNSIITCFDKKGNWLYSVEQFPAHQLLRDIIELVSLDVRNGFVTSIQKITQPFAEPVYVIQTQGKDFVKTLTLNNNQLETTATYKKG